MRDDDETAARGVSPVPVPVAPLEGITRAAANEGPGEVTPVGRAEANEATAALTAALASGATGPADAQAELIAATVASLRPADADPAVWAAVEADVAALLAGDPVLGDLLRP